MIYLRKDECGTIGTIVQVRLACTIVLIVLCNTVYYAVLLMMNDKILSEHVEQTKKVWNKN